MIKPTVLTSLILSFFFLSAVAQDTAVTDTIIGNAETDGIDLSVLDFLSVALDEITDVYTESADTTARKRTASGRLNYRATQSIIDVHTHAVPGWYKELVPTTGGNPTPDWDISSYLAFMDGEGINHSIFSISAPGANVYKGQQVATIALARLLNEQAAAYVRAYPKRLSFYAVVPLPYATAAITEAKYAINTLGAAGIILTSNFEGIYLGDSRFTPFFSAINALGKGQILYIHPSAPYIKVNGAFIEANPTTYATGNIEFYFETARTLQDLTLTQTIHNFTNINYIIPHVGGAFPAVIDRVLKSAPAIYDSSLTIYRTRFWWDSAGPTYYHQVSGLLGYGIPTTQLLFGTDFPYAPGFTQANSLAAIQASTAITSADKALLFKTNAVKLFGNKIPSS